MVEKKTEIMQNWPSSYDENRQCETGARIIGNEIRDSYREQKYRSQEKRKDFADN